MRYEGTQRVVARCLTLSALTLAVAALACPSAARAESATCAFTNVTGEVFPAIPSAIAPNGRPQVGGTGSYTFSSKSTSTVTCSMNGGDQEPSTITSSGRFLNDLCGTGRAFGDVPEETTVAAPSGRIAGMTYRIDFFGGVGQIDVLSVNGLPELHAPDPFGFGEVDGEVTFTPDRPERGTGDCVTRNVAMFRLDGVFAVDW